MILKKSLANAVDIEIGGNVKPLLIAEFGLNHNRDLDLARRMADAAFECGVNAIKLQSYTTRFFINRQFSEVHGLYDIFAGLETDLDFHRKLRDHCVAKGMIFFSTPLTVDWVENLNALEVPAFKIASGDINNWPLLNAVAATQKPLLISTGAATSDEVRAVISFASNHTITDYALLHCVSLYPTPDNKANISRIARLRELLPTNISIPLGFSDHTEGTTAAFAAVVAGASIIEKHFTLDRDLPGPDQKMSFDPTNMKKLRENIDLAWEIRGSAKNADCHIEETSSDYYGKRSLYEFEGETRAMRPRHPDYPLP
jgi:N,N'-diacetyllegionaminate synthase